MKKNIKLAHSDLVESLRGDLIALYGAGAISKVTMREFDAINPPPVREFSAADIKRLREGLKFSQPIFALHLHTSASTIRKWEQGDTHPTGAALKLLNIIADKGLQAII
ncbi:MAG: transcriptional regulator [Gallionellaceae bacterium]|nr:transcriptional regulator [Gallionellaceae bacterium]